MSNTKATKYYLEDSEGHTFVVAAPTLLGACCKWCAYVAKSQRAIHRLDDVVLVHEGQAKHARTLKLSNVIAVTNRTTWFFIQLAIVEASNDATLQLFCKRVKRPSTIHEETPF